MTKHEWFYKLLCCPEDKTELTPATEAELKEINERLSNSGLKKRNGEPVTGPIKAGLIRADKKYLYQIQNGIPVLLIEEAVKL